MEDLFEFNWLKDTNNVVLVDKYDSKIRFSALGYFVTLCTSAYSGYIISYIDNFSGERLSFNCDEIDLRKEYIKDTTKSMINRFTYVNPENGVRFPRNLRLVSVHVPGDVYNNLRKGT